MSDIIDLDELKRAYPVSSAVCFDTVYEAIDSANNKQSLFDDPSSQRTDREDWSGSSDWKEMEKIVRTGWVEGRASISSGLDTLYRSNSISISSGRDADYDVAGAYPDVPLAISGELEHMVNTGDEIDCKPIIRLVINVGANWHVESRQLMNRGAAVAALVDELESGGSSCEIHAVWTPKKINGRAQAVYCIGVKRAGESTSIDDIAFCLGHTAMLRRVMFSAMERHPFAHNHRFYGSGCYGTTVDIDEYRWPSDCVYLASITNNPDPYCTPEGAMTEVRKLYEAQAKAKQLEVDV